jgi:hypothetical protein
MREVGPASAGPTLARALTDDAPAPAPVAALLREARATPAWFDPAAADRGCAAIARTGADGMRALRDLGLMAGYRASAINQTLVRTGTLESGAPRRVTNTTAWWLECTEPGGLRPGAPGFNASVRVRVGHALVREQLRRSPDWDEDALGLPVNQVDMQATYLAFSVLFLLGQRGLGIPISAREADDVMHLWRGIGWLIGVEDGLLAHTEAAGRRALYLNLLSQPGPDETSRQLGRALADEPLAREYAVAPWLQRRWHRQLHLSIARWFIGREGMAELGLPTSVLPWYPALVAPTHLARHAAARALPGGPAWLARRGRAAQRALFATLARPT